MTLRKQPNIQQFSYSRVECFRKCPYQYKLKYIDKYKTIKNQDANNALYLGNALHLGLEEESVEAATKEYKKHYYQLNDLHIQELIKMENMLLKTTDLLTEIEGEFIHEYEINLPHYKGYIDLIVRRADGKVDIYDYKYSNNEPSYMKSGQLHIYKYFLEQIGFDVDRLGYVFIPKVQIRQKKTEDLYQFRKRLRETLKEKEPYIKWVEYDKSKIDDYLSDIESIKACTTFEKNSTRLCDWCDYKNYCLRGDTSEMILPSNERRTIEKVEKKVMWLYGAPYSGKTTLANEFPDPLMLNTDGNIKFVDAPYVAIKNKIEMDGRIKKETLAWEVFKEVLDELEKKQNDFKTLVVDLLEDIYEHCRIWGCAQLAIDHESDNSLKAYDVVRSEFLRTMNRLTNLDYENIILKTSDVVFGGGRLQGISNDTIPLSYEEIEKVYEGLNIKTSRRRSRVTQ